METSGRIREEEIDVMLHEHLGGLEGGGGREEIECQWWGEDSD